MTASMTYPTAPATDEWLQRPVREYFGAIVWAPAPPAIAVAVPAAATAIARPPVSLDLTVVQYFAHFPWDGPVAAVATAVAIPDKSPPPAMIPDAQIDSALAELLDFEPTVDPEALLDVASQDDSGSLADFSDFF
jgi:hypothetical protein